MKNRKIFLGTILCVLLLVTLIDYLEFYQLKVIRLEVSIENLINSRLNRGNESIDMKTLLSFEWDEIYVFDPYTPQEVIYETLGTKYSTANNYLVYKINKDNTGLFYDHLKKIVFMNNNKVIYTENYNYHVFDFNKNYYTYNESLFIPTLNNGNYILKPK